MSDYHSAAPPGRMEVIGACEVLMRAGYTLEAMSVLMEALPAGRERKGLVERMLGHRLVRKGEAA
jgi:hypothetical protein